MRARFYCFLVLFLHILSLVGVSSRHFPPNDGFSVNNQGTIQNPQSLHITHTSNELKGMKERMGLQEKAAKYKEIKKIGSRPPSCEHKCYGACHVKQFRCPPPAGLWGFSTQIMSQRAGNASVVLSSIAHKKIHMQILLISLKIESDFLLLFTCLRELWKTFCGILKFG
ncbi:hypothetical protein Pfo_012242 [Paulownia fortunei]|nr:hypothetical protein Pfo_012242 [Paulownia fortunei]